MFWGLKSRKDTNFYYYGKLTASVNKSNDSEMAH